MLVYYIFLCFAIIKILDFIKNRKLVALYFPLWKKEKTYWVSTPFLIIIIIIIITIIINNNNSNNNNNNNNKKTYFITNIDK